MQTVNIAVFIRNISSSKPQ